jgi:hypothetical protein
VAGVLAPTVGRRVTLGMAPAPLRDHVRFRSDMFAPRRAERDEVNPGRYGRELAEWLAARLGERGVAAGQPAPEDWGWLLEVVQDGESFGVACGNVGESRSEWLLWVDPARAGPIARLLRPGAAAGGERAREALILAIDDALGSSPGVRDIEWFRVGPREEELDHAPSPS